MKSRYLKIQCSRSVTGYLEHWMKRGYLHSFRRYAACGGKVYLGVGRKPEIRHRLANRVMLSCPECYLQLVNFLSLMGVEQQQELFDDDDRFRH